MVQSAPEAAFRVAVVAVSMGAGLRSQSGRRWARSLQQPELGEPAGVERRRGGGQTRERERESAQERARSLDGRGTSRRGCARWWPLVAGVQGARSERRRAGIRRRREGERGRARDGSVTVASAMDLPQRDSVHSWWLRAPMRASTMRVSRLSLLSAAAVPGHLARSAGSRLAAIKLGLEASARRRRSEQTHGAAARRADGGGRTAGRKESRVSGRGLGGGKWSRRRQPGPGTRGANKNGKERASEVGGGVAKEPEGGRSGVSLVREGAQKYRYLGELGIHTRLSSPLRPRRGVAAQAERDSTSGRKRVWLLLLAAVS